MSLINTDSFNGRAKHIKRAETTIYTDGSKTEFGVWAGFTMHKIIYMKIYSEFKKVCL